MVFIRKQLLSELGFNDPAAGKTSVLGHSWWVGGAVARCVRSVRRAPPHAHPLACPAQCRCESVASIAEALLKQSASVVDAAAAELRAARLEDGGLLVLLDGLLEFSIMRSKRITLVQQPQHPPVEQQPQQQGEVASPFVVEQTTPPGGVGGLLLSAGSGGGAAALLASPSKPSSASQQQPGALASLLTLASSRQASASLGAPALQHAHSDPAAALLAPAAAALPDGSRPAQSASATTPAACASCGRAVCSSCRRTLVTTGVPVLVAVPAPASSGAQAGLQEPPDATPGGGHPSGPGARGGSHAAASGGRGGPPQHEPGGRAADPQDSSSAPPLPPQQPQVLHRSVLLANLGVHGLHPPGAGGRGPAGWRPMARTSQWHGVNTVSMAGAHRRNLSLTSIPQENFGEGYGMWG